MRRASPLGPYLLGGFSFGGLVAFESAVLLQQADERVSVLVLIDTPAPGELPPPVARGGTRAGALMVERARRGCCRAHAASRGRDRARGQGRHASPGPARVGGRRPARDWPSTSCSSRCTSAPRCGTGRGVCTRGRPSSCGADLRDRTSRHPATSDGRDGSTGRSPCWSSWASTSTCCARRWSPSSASDCATSSDGSTALDAHAVEDAPLVVVGNRRMLRGEVVEQHERRLVPAHAAMELG